MIRSLSFFLLALAALSGRAGTCTIDLKAAGLESEHAMLYLFSDLVTDRLELVDQAVIAPEGTARLGTIVGATAKARIRVGLRHADLFLRPGAHYTIRVPGSAGAATTMNGTMEFVPEFEDLDLFDVNALVSDLNTRIDAFLAEGLATDETGGMQAVERVRTLGADSLPRNTRPVNVSVLPAPEPVKVDTFEAKLRRFYKDAKDAWFWHYLDYSMAGLRLGPRANEHATYERYVKGKAIGYSDPEQMRFLQNFFADELLDRVYRRAPEAVKTVVLQADADSLGRWFATDERLANDQRLRELVMLIELYTNYHGRIFDRTGIERMLAGIEAGSQYVEHRTLARNMVWDLTGMRAGSVFPSLALRSTAGDTVQLDALLEGPVCIVITAAWCAYCDQELEALEKLRMDYGQVVRFVVIGVDSSLHTFTRYARADKARDWTWLWAGDDPLFMDKLRLRTVPGYFLLNDRNIAYSPAPSPSAGMAPIFYKLKVEAEQKQRIRFGDDAPPPRR